MNPRNAAFTVITDLWSLYALLSHFTWLPQKYG